MAHAEPVARRALAVQLHPRTHRPLHRYNRRPHRGAAPRLCARRDAGPADRPESPEVDPRGRAREPRGSREWARHADRAPANSASDRRRSLDKLSEESARNARRGVDRRSPANHRVARGPDPGNDPRRGWRRGCESDRAMAHRPIAVMSATAVATRDDALTTPFTRDARVEVPLVCGAMYPCSNPELVAAVSDAGAIGIVQPISLTYVHGHEFRTGLRHVHGLTTRPIGFNALIERSSRRYHERMVAWVDIALEEGVRFFVTSLGNPRWVVDRVAQVGGVVY